MSWEQSLIFPKSYVQGEAYRFSSYKTCGSAGIIIVQSLQMRVLLENTTFLLLVRIEGIIRVAIIIRGRVLYEEIQYVFGQFCEAVLRSLGDLK
jgi:hypothetical protein